VVWLNWVHRLQHDPPCRFKVQGCLSATCLGNTRAGQRRQTCTIGTSRSKWSPGLLCVHTHFASFRLTARLTRITALCDMVFFAKFRKQACFITRLPDEVLVEQIMLMLSIEDVVALRRVCIDLSSCLVLLIFLTVRVVTRSTNFSISLPTNQSFGRLFYAL
jgi:hypothetical protein